MVLSEDSNISSIVLVQLSGRKPYLAALFKTICSLFVSSAQTRITSHDHTSYYYPQLRVFITGQCENAQKYRYLQYNIYNTTAIKIYSVLGTDHFNLLSL